MYVVPASVADFIAKVLKGDQVLVNPDHLLRGAYEQRTGDPVRRAGAGSRPPASGARGRRERRPRRRGARRLSVERAPTERC